MVSTSTTSVPLQRVDGEKHAVMNSVPQVRPRRLSIAKPTEFIQAVEKE